MSPNLNEFGDSLQVDRRLLGVHPGKTMHLLKGRHEGLTCEVSQGHAALLLSTPYCRVGDVLLPLCRGKKMQLFK